MRADQRAEFGPRIDQIQTHQVGIPQDLRLPRGVRLSIGAARLFTSTAFAVLGVTAVEVAQRFSGDTPAIAVAAEPNCRVGTRIESYVFFDMTQVLPEMGRRHIIDMGVDPRAGAGVGFTVEAVPVSYRKGDRNKPGYRPFASTNIVRDQKNDVGRGELRFTAACNTTAVTSDGKKVPGLRYKLVSNLDDNDQFEVVTPDGRRTVVAFGREIKKTEDFLRIVDSGTQKIEDLDDKKKELIVKSVQTPTPTPTSTATSTPSSTPSRTPEKTGTATSTPSSTPSRTPEKTGTATSTPTATIIRTLTVTVTETPIITATSTPTATGTPPTTLPTTFAVGGIDALGTVASVLDLPAKGIDQVTEPDTQFPVRTGIDIAGWLLAAGLLLNRPFQPRARVWNTLAWPGREVRYRITNRGVVAPPARGYPRPFGV